MSDKPEMPTVEYMIVFDDQDMADELYLDEKTARERMSMVKDNWNCHLFKRILSV